MKILAVIPLLLLAGCPGSLTLKELSAEQIKALDGLLACSQINSTYGKGSTILANADKLPKGNSTGKTVITCGDAVMTIDYSSTVPNTKSTP